MALNDTDAKPVKDSKLFIAGLVLVGILGAIALVVLPSRNAPDMRSGMSPLPIRRSYAWLDQCGTGCEQKLGYVEVMAGAGESKRIVAVRGSGLSLKTVK